MAKCIHLIVVLMVVTVIQASQLESNQRHQRTSNQDIALEDFNKIDHGEKQAKPEPELFDKSVASKKISHKKKIKIEKESNGEDGHKTLGHRGEQKWRSKDHEIKKKTDRFDSKEDLHLQDLSYNDHARKNSHMGADENDFRRKMHKDKIDHTKLYKKEKKYKKEKDMKKDKEMKKKDKEMKKKPKNRKSNQKDQSFEAIP